jgi:hypothetical protein
LEVVLVGADTADNNLSDQVLALHQVLASKAVASEEGLVVAAAVSEVASAVIEAVDLVIEEASVAGVVLDIKPVVGMEAGVGTRTVPLPSMPPADQVVVVVGLVVVKRTGQPHLITPTVAETVMVIARHTAVAARPEPQGMTAVSREALQEAIENQSSRETEAMAGIETVTETENVGIVTGMAEVDETMTTVRENDTTKVMDTMIREAKEGIKSLSL